MPTYYTCSIITSTKEIFQDVKTKLGTITSAVPGIPDRVVEKSPAYNAFSKVGVYYLTKDEYLALTGSNVLDKQLITATIDLHPEAPLVNTSSPDPKDYGYNVSGSVSGSGRAKITIYPGSGYWENYVESEPRPNTTSSMSYTASRWVDPTMPRMELLSDQSGWYTAMDGMTFADPKMNIHGLNDQHSGSLRAWMTSYITNQDVNNLYSGSKDDNGTVIDGGSYTHKKYFESSSQNELNRDYVLDGTGVDMIVLEHSWCSHLHADFFDKEGKTRVQYPNWYIMTGQPDRATEQPECMYPNWDHRWVHANQSVSLSAGLMSGLAKGSHIYPFICDMSANENNSISKWSLPNAFSVIKRFHESKSIEPTTGYKRPTVVTISMGSSACHHLPGLRSPEALKFHEDAWETAKWGDTVENLGADAAVSGANANGFYGIEYMWGPHTASIHGLNLQENEGIRFEYLGNNYVFISSSAQTFGTAHFKNLKNNWHINTFTGSLHNLVQTINSNGQYYGETNFMVSCNLGGNPSGWPYHAKLHITSSFPAILPTAEDGNGTNAIPPGGNPRSIQAQSVAIYTGSFNPDNYMFPLSVGTHEYTGSLQAYLGGPGSLGERFLSHIDSIVVNGVDQGNGSNNNYLNSSHGYRLVANKDIWGDDGVDKALDNCVWNRAHIIINDRYSHNRHNYAPLWTGALYQELAEAGVIVVKGAGNHGVFITQTGSAEDNPFSDPDKYSPEVDNYYTNDIDTTLGFAGEPIYYNRADPFNGSVIIAGGLLQDQGLDQRLLTSLGAGSWGINPGSNYSQTAPIWDVGPRKVITNPLFDPQDTSTYHILELDEGYGLGQSLNPEYTHSIQWKMQVGFNHGPGVDIIAPALNGLIACNALGLGNSPGRFMSIPELDNIDFDVDSAIQSALTASITSVQQTEGQPTLVPLLDTLTPEESGDPELHGWFDPVLSKRYQANSGGTSAATPIVAGMIACWLQQNPWANVKDVRNWLKTMPSVFPNIPGNLLDKTYWRGYIDIDASGSRVPSGFRRDSGSMQLGGPNACTRVTHFPEMGKKHVAEFRGIDLQGLSYKS